MGADGYEGIVGERLQLIPGHAKLTANRGFIELGGEAVRHWIFPCYFQFDSLARV
jgi:hypothetical protein